MSKEKTGYVTYDEVKKTNVPIGKVTLVEEVKAPVVYDSMAYSLSEGEGFFQVIGIEYNTRTLETGVAKLIEKNTEKSIITERLTVLLFNRDFL